MYYKIAPYILRNRKKIIPLALIGLFINLFLSKLIQRNLDELFTKGAIITILLPNIVFFVLYFVVIGWCYVTRNWQIYELDTIVCPFAVIILIVLLAISIPVVWISNKYDFSNFVLVWWIIFFAISAESKNLDDYFEPPRSERAIIFHNDVTIRDDTLVFTSPSKEKSFVIAEIEVLDIQISANNSFSIKIHSDRLYTFYVVYTEKNIEVLKNLTQICKNTPVTDEELETMVRNFASLDKNQKPHPVNPLR